MVRRRGTQGNESHRSRLPLVSEPAESQERKLLDQEMMLRQQDTACDLDKWCRVSSRNSNVYIDMFLCTLDRCVYK